jgi:hypothetical protein
VTFLPFSILDGLLSDDDTPRRRRQGFGISAQRTEWLTFPKAIMDAPFSSQVHSLGIVTFSLQHQMVYREIRPSISSSNQSWTVI